MGINKIAGPDQHCHLVEPAIKTATSRYEPNPVPLNVATGSAAPVREDRSVLFACLYAVGSRLLSLLVLRGRGEESKDVELVLLRHEVAVSRRQTPHPRLKPAARLIISLLASALPRAMRDADRQPRHPAALAP